MEPFAWSRMSPRTLNFLVLLVMGLALILLKIWAERRRREGRPLLQDEFAFHSRVAELRARDPAAALALLEEHYGPRLRRESAQWEALERGDTLSAQDAKELHQHLISSINDLEKQLRSLSDGESRGILPRKDLELLLTADRRSLEELHRQTGSRSSSDFEDDRRST